MTDPTETTEVTEETEETETTEDTEIKEATANGVIISKKDKYAVVSAGETVTLPGYSFETTGDDEPEVEWLIDDNSIAALTTSKVD